MAVHKRLERDELRELTAKHLRAAPESVNQASGSLKILGEIVHLIETLGIRTRVHEEMGWPVELDNDAAGFREVAFVILEVNALDVGEWVLNLVPSLLIVNIVGHGTLVRRVEND